MKIKMVPAIMFPAAAFMAFSVNAATSPATATFQVQMTINKACTVSGGNNISLGSVDATATNVTGNNVFKVTCSKTTPYNIGLSPSSLNATGAGTLTSVTNPAMNTDKPAYQLNQGSATGPVWGNTATSLLVGNGVTGIGSGAIQTYTVYATVANALYTPDNYSDTVTINVNF